MKQFINIIPFCIALILFGANVKHNLKKNDYANLVWFKIDLSVYPSETSNYTTVSKLIKGEFSDLDMDLIVDEGEYTIRTISQATAWFGCDGDIYKCAYGFYPTDLIVNPSTYYLEPSVTASPVASIYYTPWDE